MSIQNNKVQNNRIEYLDVFRASGIILMIMGHIGFGAEFDKFIHAFHMPMFFWVSGYFFNDKVEFSRFLRKKITTILLPYLFFGFLHYGIYCIINGVDLKPLKCLLLYPNKEGMPIAGSLWFLVSLFWAEIIFYFLRKLIRRTDYEYIYIISFAVIVYVVNQCIKMDIPFALDSAMMGVVFMHIGKLAKGKLDKLESVRIRYMFILSIFTISSIMFNGYINMRTNEYSCYILFIINAILAIIVGVYFSIMICKLFKNKVVLVALVNIGKYSIVYLCLNQIVILVCTKFINIIINNEISHLFVFLLTIITLYIISYIIIHTKLKILIGK